MHALGHVPVAGDSVELTAFEPDAFDDPPRWQATVVRMDERRIDLLDLVKLPATAGARDE